MHGDLCKFMTSRWIFLRTRNISDKNCRGNENTILCSLTFFFLNVSLMIQCGKTWYSLAGHKWQHNKAQKKMGLTWRITKARIQTPIYYLFLWRCGPTRAMASSFLRFLDHTQDASQSVGLLWTSDQLVAETSAWQHITITTDKQPCPPVGFEPTISASERPQTYALDRAATGTGTNTHTYS